VTHALRHQLRVQAGPIHRFAAVSQFVVSRSTAWQMIQTAVCAA